MVVTFGSYLGHPLICKYPKIFIKQYQRNYKEHTYKMNRQDPKYDDKIEAKKKSARPLK
jgi:hypothetical protein